MTTPCRRSGIQRGNRPQTSKDICLLSAPGHVSGFLPTTTSQRTGEGIWPKYQPVILKKSVTREGRTKHGPQKNGRKSEEKQVACKFLQKIPRISAGEEKNLHQIFSFRNMQVEFKKKSRNGKNLTKNWSQGKAGPKCGISENSQQSPKKNSQCFLCFFRLQNLCLGGCVFSFGFEFAFHPLLSPTLRGGGVVTKCLWARPRAFAEGLVQGKKLQCRRHRKNLDLNIGVAGNPEGGEQPPTTMGFLVFPPQPCLGRTDRRPSFMQKNAVPAHSLKNPQKKWQKKIATVWQKKITKVWQKHVDIGEENESWHFRSSAQNVKKCTFDCF